MDNASVMSQQGTGASGDVMSPAGFSAFYRAHLATVYGYLYRLAGSDRSLAENLTQDTFVALTRELRKGRPECADVRWLLTVARGRVRQSSGRTIGISTTLIRLPSRGESSHMMMEPGPGW